MEWTSWIPWIISMGMFVLSLITLSRTGRRDRKADYVEDAKKIDSIKESLTKANVKLDTICNTMSETRADIKAMDKNINEVEGRVSIIENELKSVWARINELKDKVGFYHEQGN